MRYRYVLALMALFFFLPSCAGLNQTQQSNLMNYIEQGNFQNATHVIQDKIDLQNKNKDISILVGLQSGICYQNTYQYKKAIKVFDITERQIKEQDEAWMAGNVQKSVVSTLLNESLAVYERREYDAIMLNTYKALSFMFQGDMQNARIEFNRALDRQRRAKEYFQNRIAKKREKLREREKEKRKELSKKSEEDGLPTVNSLMKKEEVNATLQKRYSNLDNFAVYPEFINPFTTYISGLFFFLQSDYSKANTYLKETYGMIENKKAVEKDFHDVEKILNKGAPPPQEKVWVIFANGLAPEKKEWRLDLPLFAVNKKVLHTGIALPKLEPRNPAQPFLQIQPSAQEEIYTHKLASMDGVIAQEFKKEYPYIMARALTSALFKAAVQYYAEEEFGTLGSVVGAVYSAVSTGADTRMWQGLPKNFQVARFDRPQDGIIHINTPQDECLKTVSVPEGKNSIVFFKQTTSQARVFTDVTSF